MHGNNDVVVKKRGDFLPMDTPKMKVINSLTVIMLCLLLLFCVLPIHGEREIYDRVLRLHVIANSDSDLDQSLKLEVRDAVLEYCAPLLRNAENREQAAEIIKANKSEIENIAKKTLVENSCNMNVTMEVCQERYPTKNYESFCFPEGSYLSVKLMIGEAEGQNWWCVLFPKLCTEAVTSPEEEFVAVGFTPDQYKIITESESTSYKIRFKFLEFFEGLGER